MSKTTLSRALMQYGVSILALAVAVALLYLGDGSGAIVMVVVAGVLAAAAYCLGYGIWGF